MQDVAAVSLYVLDNWLGSKVDQQLTVRSALLHDLGNLVKFKRPFVGELENEAEHWVAIQQEMVAKYGSNAKKATHQLVAEIGLANSIGKVLSHMDKLIDGDLAVMPEAQIVEFADLCVSPEGIVGYQRRKQDLIDRYGATHGLAWVEPADKLHGEIKKIVSINLDSIETNDYSLHVKKISDLVNQQLISNA